MIHLAMLNIFFSYISERILKIDLHLPKLWSKIEGNVFMEHGVE